MEKIAVVIMDDMNELADVLIFENVLDAADYCMEKEWGKNWREELKHDLDIEESYEAFKNAGSSEPIPSITGDETYFIFRNAKNFAG